MKTAIENKGGQFKMTGKVEDRELLAVYQDEVNGDARIEDARNSFAGKFDSESDWAENFLAKIGMLEQIPENLRGYFDYAAYARDARLGGGVVFVRRQGDVWVFWNPLQAAR
jgi:antirestriction protein